MKATILKLLPIVDLLLQPFLVPAALLLSRIRRTGLHRLPKCRETLITLGVFPILDHYYEPQFNFRQLRRSLSEERRLPGIDMNVDEQLQLLAKFSFASELAETPFEKPVPLDFYLDNPSFGSGDAEYWYQLIRTVRPRRIIEIGSGYSTLIAMKAIRRNQMDDSEYRCDHVCVEPYEMPWLEDTGVHVVRQKVEDLDPGFFADLSRNDILFIDSSHVLRPQGDVLFEFLEILPTLQIGVIVHVHDVFTPRDYPPSWLLEENRFWNEQYLLEAFLTHNDSWKILGALNYLRHNHFESLRLAAPFLTADREPGSFYMIRTH